MPLMTPAEYRDNARRFRAKAAELPLDDEDREILERTAGNFEVLARAVEWAAATQR